MPPVRFPSEFIEETALRAHRRSANKVIGLRDALVIDCPF